MSMIEVGESVDVITNPIVYNSFFEIMKIIKKEKIDCFQFDDNEITNDLKNTTNNITVNTFN